ncbi:MAG: SDR family NAD(P)-dependent oxidoreductase [Acidimicrobiales bacterium]
MTGGGGGIGAAVARDLGRRGTHVVTVDPLVSVDGAEVLPAPEETTAGQIVAAGGSAEASNLSVTDRSGVADLFARLVDQHGRLDGVVNVAGITRPTGFAKGSDEDWAAVLSVHLDGYLSVLAAALPLMAETGLGRIVGVTSGSGWRAADAGAYSAAKRAVASLTWQLGSLAPEGVAVNAISPIALTRMVTAALGRAGGGAAAKPGGTSKTGGLSLGAMPDPDELAPLAAHLVGPSVGLRGRILFAGGSEVATVEAPRLVEVVRTSDVASVDAVLATFADALVAAEGAQGTTGGANPRFPGLVDAVAPLASIEGGQAALIVTDRPELGAAVAAGLQAVGVATEVLPAASVEPGVDGIGAVLDRAIAAHGALDAVVVATGSPSAGGGGWEAVLASHEGLAGLVQVDAAWGRAAAERATEERPMRVVHLVDAGSAGGRSRAQAAAQLARTSRRATGDRVAAFAVSLEALAQVEVAAALATRLATTADLALSGAELAIGPGWLGLRSHPRPGTSLVFGGPDLPPWFDAVLGELP